VDSEACVLFALYLHRFGASHNMRKAPRVAVQVILQRLQGSFASCAASAMEADHCDLPEGKMQDRSA